MASQLGPAGVPGWHRLDVAVLMRRRDGAVLVVASPDGWALPGGPVPTGSSPRGAAGQTLLRLALEPSLGRLLVQDFRSADDGGTQVLVYDAGAWSTDLDGFTADGGSVRAAFCPVADLAARLGAAGAERAAAGLAALELGFLAELEDGLDATPGAVPGNGAPPRRMMPDLPVSSPVLAAR